MGRCGSYTFGNCTWGVCQDQAWVPEQLGDGGDWAANWAARGGQVVGSPLAGTVVSYCRGGGYSDFGHVAEVVQVYDNGTFLVREMNFAAFDAYDLRVSNMHDVCGFLVPPGGPTGGGSNQTAPGGGGGADDVRGAWAQLQDWLNSGAEWWVNEINTASNLLSGIG